MIDGLKLTLNGQQIRDLLDERIRVHEARVRRWKRELARTPEQQTDDEPLLPDQICENEAEREEWRVDVLTFIRDHIEPREAYRIGAADLEFAELLAEKPGWLEQDEYEERTGVRSNLERLTREVGRLGSAAYAYAEFGRRDGLDDDDVTDDP